MQRITEVGGLFIGGNPATNTKGTVLTAAWANAVQEEIARTIEIAGISLSGGSNEQLSAAVSAMITAAIVARVATTTVAGIIETSTNTETQTGTAANVAVTPASLTSRTATETRTGVVELATEAETLAGTDATRAVHPAGLAGTVFGFGQAWSDVTASRALATTYTNSSGKPIAVNAFLQSNANNASPLLTIGGGSLIVYGPSQQNATYASAVFGIIPNGATYAITVSAGSGTLIKWSELR